MSARSRWRNAHPRRPKPNDPPHEFVEAWSDVVNGVRVHGRALGISKAELRAELTEVAKFPGVEHILPRKEA